MHSVEATARLRRQRHQNNVQQTVHRTYDLEVPETHGLLVHIIVHSQEPGLVLFAHIACFVVWWNGLLPCRHQHGRCDAGTCAIQRPMTLHQLLRVLLHQALEIMFLHLLQIRGVDAETWMRNWTRKSTAGLCSCSELGVSTLKIGRATMEPSPESLPRFSL